MTYRIYRIRPGNQSKNTTVTSDAVGSSPENALQCFAEGEHGDLVVPGSWSEKEDIYFVAPVKPAGQGGKLLRVEPVVSPIYKVVPVACV